MDFKTGCASVSLGKQGAVDTPRKLRRKNCVGVRKIYNCGSFQRQGESSQSAVSRVSSEQ